VTSLYDAATAAALIRGAGGDADGIMLRLLAGAASFAHAPVSGFRVGAIVRGSSGALYAGANLEFAGEPLGCSVHAEQAAVANARAHGERGIVALAVTAAPCGLCRQFLMELPAAGALRVVRANRSPVTLRALLPDAFGPHDLGVAAAALGADVATLELDEPSGDPLVLAAREAAERAHAPYSGTLAGAALRSADGTLHRGSAFESVAYNPTLAPLQAALSSLVLSGREVTDVAGAALVETAGRVSYRTHATALLQRVAGVTLLCAGARAAR
jgi:cytidine deaminase